MTAKVLALVLVILASGPVTDKNWMRHPEITKIRKIFKAIQRDLGSGQITCKKTSPDPEKSPYDRELELCTDHAGVVRKYVRAGGSDDSALTQTYYYDTRGRLRFLFATGGAVNGTEIQHRVYLDAGGQRIWEIQKKIKGPGYTFPATWPAEELIHDPLAAFAGRDGTKKPAGAASFRAVVAIIDQHANGSEDWGLFCDDIAQACLKNGNFFDAVEKKQPKAFLEKSSGPMPSLDMTPFLAKHSIGWVLVEYAGGKISKTFLAYDMANVAKAQAFCSKKPAR